MQPDLAKVLALLIAAIVMFAVNKPRLDAVALIMLTALPLTGTVTMGEALAGFSDPNIVLIAALFVVGEGLVRTGVARQLGDWLAAKAGSSDVKLLVLLMLVVCGLGSIMSSTAVTAIFIPVALRIAQSTGKSPSGLMMPLSFAALISGMMTLVATAPNLVVNSELVRRGEEGFAFFSFAPFGVPVLVLGILYMTFARRWLTGRDGVESRRPRRSSLRDWVEDYRLTAREHRVRVLPQSSLVGKTLAELRLRREAGANLVAIERDRKLVEPIASTQIQAGDILFVDLWSEGVDVAPLIQMYGLESLPLSGAYFTDLSQDIGMVEVIVPASSELAGKTIAEADLRARHRLTAVGLRRDSAPIEGNVRESRIEIGDTLLLIGPWSAIRNLQADSRNFVPFNLPVELQEVLPVPGKAAQAMACLLLVVGLMVWGVVPNVQAALIGCLLMGALGIVDLNSAYRAIDWKTIVLIVGMLPFSIALERTGGVDLAAEGLMSIVGGAGDRMVLAAIFAITALLGMFISNTATAVLMAPVALAVADDLGASPYPFAMIVALAASTAFMTPVSSPVNTLVVTPGNYTFGDFVRVGVPFSVIVLIVSVLLVPLLLPL
jgi:di/tricarboxylate transporter